MMVQQFQESLGRGLENAEDDQYLGTAPYVVSGDEKLIEIGLSLRELIFEYKHQALVLFKCCLLQPKVRPDFLGHSPIPQHRPALCRYLNPLL